MGKKKKPKKSGETKKVLCRRIEQLEARLRELRIGQAQRFEGERWYRLDSLFNGDTIRSFPGKTGPMHIMGLIDSLMVVQVATSEPEESVEKFLQSLYNFGVQAPTIVLRDQTRFLKLSTISPEEEAALDAAELAHENTTADSASDETSAGAGPQSPVNGLGSRSSGHAGGDGDGCDHHEAPAEDGAKFQG